MENPINITALNDFVFCPISIYFHKLYMDMDKNLYQCNDQINGTQAHKNIDSHTYKTDEKVILGMSVYCEKYNLIGKIDMYYPKTSKVVERKKKIKSVYDGYVFQLYGQYFAMKEMGFDVKRLVLHSIDDNKNYCIALPEDDVEMLGKFESVIKSVNEFDMFSYNQDNGEKCKRCIYEPVCDRSLMNC